MKKMLFWSTTVCLLFLVSLCGYQMSFAQSSKPVQKTIVIMMDGFGEQYYRNAAMPFLNKMEKEGIYKVVPSLMPAVTNVNNMAIATGKPAAENGITGNVFFNEKIQKEEFVEDPSLLLSPTLFQKAHQRGLKSALLSVKKKTIDVLGKYADYTLCPECEVANKNKWIGKPALSDVYTREVNYQLMDAAITLLQTHPEINLMYIHTSDYPMHMWPPQSDSVKTFLSQIDTYISKLHETAPDAAILITADHGMNHKSQAWDLQKVCADSQTPVKIVISPENDRYVKHHKGLGGSAYVYLLKGSDAAQVKKTLLHIKGVESVLTRQEAAKKFKLSTDRIGDFMVLADVNTVFGNLNGNASEKLDENYRSHGSSYEAQVPLFVFNARNAPKPDYFTWNYKLAAWIFN